MRYEGNTGYWLEVVLKNNISVDKSFLMDSHFMLDGLSLQAVEEAFADNPARQAAREQYSFARSPRVESTATRCVS